jgi:hypothetical protein
MDILKSLEEGRDKFRYEVSFVGRKAGAIGITHPITDVVELDEAGDQDEIEKALYGKYECISKLDYKKKWICYYRNCQDRSRSLCALCYE